RACSALWPLPSSCCDRPLSEGAFLTTWAIHQDLDGFAVYGASDPSLPHDDVRQHLCGDLSFPVRFHLSRGAAADPVIRRCHGRATGGHDHQWTSVRARWLGRIWLLFDEPVVTDLATEVRAFSGVPGNNRCHGRP